MKFALQRIKVEYTQAVENNQIDHIEVHYKNGTKAGIGNNEAIKVAMTALIEELQRQIDEIK